VVIDNFYSDGLTIPPGEANAPLVIDANAVLALSVVFQRFQAIARRDLQISKNAGPMKILQLSSCGVLDCIWQASGTFTPKDPLCLGTGEAYYHHATIASYLAPSIPARPHPTAVREPGTAATPDPF
jgi:hypothetical protein